MSASILITQFTFVRRTLGANLDGISEEQSRATPAPDAHSVNWILGHMLATRNRIHMLVGLEPALDGASTAAYARGSAELGPDDGLSLGDLVAGLDASQSALLARLPEVDLEAEVPEDQRVFGDANLGGQLAGLAFHESYHAGQVGLLRRSLGHPTGIA